MRNISKLFILCSVFIVAATSFGAAHYDVVSQDSGATIEARQPLPDMPNSHIPTIENVQFVGQNAIDPIITGSGKQ